MLAALWGRVQSWLLMAGAVVLVLIGAYAAGARAARRSVELDNARREADTTRRLNRVDQKHDSMDTDALRDRARQRLRDRAKG